MPCKSRVSAPGSYVSDLLPSSSSLKMHDGWFRRRRRAASKRSGRPFFEQCRRHDDDTEQHPARQCVVPLDKTPSKFLLEIEHWNPPKPSGARPNQQNPCPLDPLAPMAVVRGLADLCCLPKKMPPAFIPSQIHFTSIAGSTTTTTRGWRS